MRDKTNLHVYGRVTDDAIVAYTQTGKAVVNFTIADNISRYDEVERKWKTVKTYFWRVSYWTSEKEIAEDIAAHFAKGDMASADGRPSFSTYQHRETGETRVSLDLNANIVRKEIQAYAQHGGNQGSYGGGYGNDHQGNNYGGGYNGGYQGNNHGGGYSVGYQGNNYGEGNLGGHVGDAPRNNNYGGNQGGGYSGSNQQGNTYNGNAQEGSYNNPPSPGDGFNNGGNVDLWNSAPAVGESGFGLKKY